MCLTLYKEQQVARKSSTPKSTRKTELHEEEAIKRHCRECALVYDLSYPSVVDGRPLLGRCQHNKHGGRFLDLLSREACPHFKLKKTNGNQD